MSSEKPKIDVDELMSLYIDGEASQRQQTELKRMMLNDPSIAHNLNDLQRQRKLLAAMPIESAPETLIDGVMGELERKLILGSAEESTQAARTGRIAMSRWSAAAAMVLVPVGLLSIVVWNIVKPADRGGIEYVPTNERVAAVPAVPAPTAELPVVTELPFNGTLVLRTDEFMKVSDGVWKAIEKTGLVSEMMSKTKRTADVTSFSITAAPKKIAELMDALADARSKCKTATLEVAQAGGQIVRITEPKIRQIKTLLFEDNIDMLSRLAGRYAEANLKPDTLLAKSDEETPTLSEDGYPTASVPVLAGTYDQPDAKIQLTIHVERSF